MRIKRRIIIEQDVKYLYAHLDVRYYENAEYFYDGGPVENIDEDGNLLPEEIFKEWDGSLTEDKSFNNRNTGKKICSFLINIDEGKVENWKQGFALKTHWKVVDQGLYQYLDGEKNIIVEYAGYCPDELGIDDNSYGDYIIMTIDETGSIKDWPYVKGRIADTINFIDKNEDEDY